MISKKVEIVNMEIEKISLFLENPRHEKTENQSETYQALLQATNPRNIYNLADDICKNGLDPQELPIVVKDENFKDKFIVYEGNRRILAIKCVINPKILLETNNKSWYEDFSKLNKNYEDKVPKKINVVIENHENAIKLIQKTHTGPLNGIGRMQWGSWEKDQFNFNFLDANKKTVSFLIKEVIESETEKPLNKELNNTDIKRIFNSTAVKSYIKVKDYENLSKEQIKKINLIAKTIVDIKKEKNMPISRILNTKEDILKFVNSLSLNNELSNNFSQQKTNKKNLLVHPNNYIIKNNNDSTSIIKNSKIENKYLFSEEWANKFIIKLNDEKFTKLKALINNLSKTKFLEDKEFTNITLISFCLRTIFEYTNVFFQEIVMNKNMNEIAKNRSHLKDFVQKSIDFMISKNLITREQIKLKLYDTKLIDKLNGSIHDHIEELTKEDLMEIFRRFKRIFEVWWSEISTGKK